MIKPALSILFFILIAPVLAIAEEPGLGKQSIENDAAFYELKSAKSIECYFPQGSFANWRGQSMKLEEDHISNAIHFDNIDTSNKKTS
ncbi:hypothetical protein [Legionella pneumophila]|uniref:Uncharacterized protein n=1 Tax=Legionella pneumophila subsp. pneumophila TaxID=91891 RepID=A0AAV2UZE0_LEGPN|nr:hypothetical protein [Legionella pneumophila]CCD06487.1 exported protein of unknown function [Legionella pneumophila subsp. pneumophila]